MFIYNIIFFCGFLSLSNGAISVGSPTVRTHPCNNTKVIVEVFERYQPPDDANKYLLFIDLFTYNNGKKLPGNSNIVLTFDTEAKLTLDTKIGRISTIGQNKYSIRVHEEKGDWIRMTVRGEEYKLFPNILSVKINGDELCPSGVRTGIWDDYISNEIVSPRFLNLKNLTSTCGIRVIKHLELITNGFDTKPGDWPWHAALLRSNFGEEKYICGGSLINPFTVISAGHCVHESKALIIPSRLHVYLGKYNLRGGDSGTRKFSVNKIIPHPNFNTNTLKHDITLIKLDSEVSYGLYIQPICLWERDSIEKSNIYNRHGTIVGWGFTHKNKISQQLIQGTMPVVSDIICLKSYPSHFEKYLNDNTFCAGFRNGTSACNGDSGGGMYFSRIENGAELWFLRGIISLSVRKANQNVCDPNHYIVFTDIAPYLDWIEYNLARS